MRSWIQRLKISCERRLHDLGFHQDLAITSPAPPNQPASSPSSSLFPTLSHALVQTSPETAVEKYQQCHGGAWVQAADSRGLQLSLGEAASGIIPGRGKLLGLHHHHHHRRRRHQASHFPRGEPDEAPHTRASSRANEPLNWNNLEGRNRCGAGKVLSEIPAKCCSLAPPRKHVTAAACTPAAGGDGGGVDEGAVPGHHTAPLTQRRTKNNHSIDF
ncbi:hypothetical protein O3P69_001922 [Scylla paramamosain]|uniref:Uncharacterized protein n=1 Tax=Scylla paramamosain TaxID=85552 RepID=A0AAW0V4H9_SCYPA